MNSSPKNTDQLPPIWNIRADRCEDFAEQTETLGRLQETLDSRNICVLAPPAPDMPGIGITTLALEYAYSHASDYQLVWWVDAQHLATMGVEFTLLGNALDLVNQKEDKSFFTVQQVKNLLETHQGWLLIFDNVPDPDLVSSFLPKKIMGHVIVTTSQPPEHTDLPSISVDPIDASSASETMGNHPLNGNLLALNLIIAYHDESKEPIQPILVVLKNTLNGMQDPTNPDAIQLVLRYSLNLLNQRFTTARDFLALCTFFNPNDIPYFLFKDVKDHLTPRLLKAMATEESFNELIAPLLRLKLLEREENCLSMHPAVQSVIRDGMSVVPYKAWANAAVMLINSKFPFESQYEKPNSKCSRLIAHLLHACDLAEEYEVGLEFVSTLLYQAGLYIHEHHLLEETQMCYLRSINIAERKLGTTHPTIATRVNNLGIVEHELSNLDNAQACFERAIEICETLYGPTTDAGHSDISDSMLTMPLRNLCSILEDKGNVKRAQRAFEKAMKTFVDVYGWNHSVVAECAHNFGNTWKKLGKYKKAQNCYIKAIRADENAHECDNAALARYLNSLGTNLIRNGNAESAVEQIQRALRLDENEFHDQHINVGRDLINLGHAFKSLHDFDSSERSYRQALDIIENQENSFQTELATLLLNLGIILISKNEHSQARPLLDQSLILHSTLYGSDSPELVATMVNLGKALDGLDAFSQARDMYEQALAILEEHDSENLTDQATILYRMGRSHEKDEEYDTAEEYYEKAMNIDTKHSGPEHLNVARDASGMGSVLIHKGDTIVAMGHLTLALDIYENTLGKSHPRTRSVRRRLDKIS